MPDLEIFGYLKSNMEFGRVADTAGINLELPPDHPDTAKVLRASGFGGREVVNAGKTQPPAQRPEVLVGLAKWGQEVARKLYPKGTPTGSRLQEYARMFNSVELNATGHAVNPALIPKWASQTPAGFKFCPKVPREITHGPNLEFAGELYEKFCLAAEAFGDRLGTVLLQFEEKSFGPWRFQELEAFLRAHSSRLPLAVEVRHKDWFAKEKSREAYFALLSELGIGAVIVDSPGRRDLVHQRLTVPETFIRFAGHDRGERDIARVEEWAVRLKAWMDLGLRRLHIFTHHVPDYLAADWAVDFIHSLNRVCGIGLKAPTLIPDAPAHLQPDLFGLS